jgi:hypothetical protein
MSMNTKTRKILIVVVLGAMVAIAGCAEQDVNNDGEKLANDTGEDISGVQPGESYQFEIKLTEKNQKGLVVAQPPFQMEHSLERANLIQRYKYLNDENNVHHVYLIDEGQVVGYYVAQGKVSSVNSKLTNDQQIIATKECLSHSGANGGDDETNCYKAVESPQMDGSYGSNGDAIFFFTTSGDYVESNLDYVVSEEPKNIQDEVLLVESTDDEDDNSTAGNNTVAV